MKRSHEFNGKQRGIYGRFACGKGKKEMLELYYDNKIKCYKL